ncbi:MAG: DUF308 domain-containing protein [Clostridia bacterium]|nr:DUF308 domain-containing protein [Clostridia bacterium]
MASKKSKQVANALIYALIYIVLGILFCIYRGSVARWCVIGIGVLLIVQGVLDMMNRRLVQGILEAAVGVLAIVFAAAVAKYAIIVLGVILLVWAVLRLFDSTKKTPLALLYIVGAAVVGVLMIINAFAVASWFFLVIGILLIVEGILCLIPASARK